MKASEKYEIIICGNNETLFGGHIDDWNADQAWSECMSPVVLEIDNVRVVTGFHFWNGGPGYAKGLVCCEDDNFRKRDVDRLRKAIDKARDRAEQLQDEANNDAE